MERIQTISPTINQADKKLNGVIQAVQFKHKRLMNFVLKNNIKNNNNQDDVLESSLNLGEDDDTGGASAINNIHYVQQKLEGVKEIILDKFHELIQKMFEEFVREFTHDRNPLFEKNKLIFFCLLKTEGDIMIELGDYNKAIQAYKALRNYCRVWGMIE